MFAKLKNALKNFWQKFIELKTRLNRITYSPKSHQKFLEWAKENNYKILKLEVSSTWEAGFFIVPKSAVCVKTILADKQNVEKGAYLLSGFGFPVSATQAKFVEAEKIKFREPYKIGDDGETLPLNSTPELAVDSRERQ